MKGLMSSRKARGFSLVELIVVMFILAICLMGLMALQMASIRSLAGNRSREMAVSLSKSVLDQAQAVSLMNRMTLYDMPGGGVANNDFIAPGRTEGDVLFSIDGTPPTAEKPVYFRVHWVSDVPPNNMPRTKELRVETFWTAEPGPNGGGPVQKSVSMNRLIQH